MIRVLDIVVIILDFIIAIAFSSLIITFSIHLYKQFTKFKQLMLITLLGFGFGILYDCIRSISWIFSGTFLVEIDSFMFFLKVFLILVGMYCMLGVVVTLNKQSGREIKYVLIIKALYIFLTGFFATLNATTFFTKDTTEFGFYAYQVDEVTYILMLVFYLPFFIFLANESRYFVTKVENPVLTNQFKFLGVLFGFLFVERFYTIGHYYFPFTNVFHLVDLSLLTFISLGSWILFFRNKNLMDMISTYFNVTSIYLIRKEGGQLLFNHDFKEQDAQDALSPTRFLLGGFIHAATRGLEHILKIWGKMEAIKIGDTTLLFKDGKYMLGIIFVSENIPIVHLRLIMLMQKFERQFEHALENWTGNLSMFKSDEIQNWVLEIFR